MSTDLSHVRLGTSSWTYEGWQGLVSQRAYPKSRFSQDTLAESAGYENAWHPALSHRRHRPFLLSPGQRHATRHYARQVPEDFRFCSKVWEEITIPAFANLPRYGAKAGKPNPRFLDTGVFLDLVWASAQESLGSKLGLFIFEFQRWDMEPVAFLEALDRFLGTLPPGPQYATEVRNPAILGSRYLNILRTHQVSHVYNHWTAMSPLSDQHRLLEQTFTAPMSLSGSSRRWDSPMRKPSNDTHPTTGSLPHNLA